MSTPFFPMNAEADEQAGIVFFKALRLPPGERQTFLHKECGTGEQLRAEVDGLLRDHENAGSFLSGEAPAATGLETQIARIAPEAAGGRIGHYKLLQQIGEGGCGVVWMAEQEEPVRRRVAVKVIKLGMDTKQVIARFEAERQALALMDHPNIAKVLDAGATDAGRPYFVMELVRGLRITSYCDQNNLPTTARLALFTQVCQAVQHAHQKGIIHRDIKPSNILVTLHDGVPVPKVIDFGIAKATTGQLLTDKTVFTAFEQFIGTPAYMSPEQAEMSGLDIDTRSDVYALGVLLYELLTGRTPFDAKELLASGLDAMRRTIREQEPPRPSTRLSTMLAADVTTVAKHHQTEAVKLTHSISGDLDWIVMKALEKDRTRRYETANGLASDIQRHLNNEPVTARPASNLYRFRKLVRRNKLAFAAAGAVLAALIIGLGISTWMFFREKQARQRAVAAEQEQGRLRQVAEAQEKKATTEASKSGQVAQFLTDMLKGVGPSVALGRDTIMLREILDKTAERVGKDLQDQPEVEAELRTTIGGVYWDLGDPSKAEPMFREALAIPKKLFGNEHPDVARSLTWVAWVLGYFGDFDKAEATCLEALAILGRSIGNALDEAKAKQCLAGLYSLQRRFAEAEVLNREVLAIRRKLLGDQDPEVVISLSNLAIEVRAQEGGLAKSETMFRDVLAMNRKLLGDESPGVANSLHDLAFTLWKLNKFSEAESLFLEALEMRRKLLPGDHPRLAMTRNDFADMLREQGKLEAAEPLYREALEIARKLVGKPADDALGVGRPLKCLAEVLYRLGKFAESEALCRELLATARESGAGEPSVAEQRLNDLAEFLYRLGKYAESEPLYREMLASRMARLTDEDMGTVLPSASLARLLTDWAWSERGAPFKTQNLKPEIPERAREAERLLRDCLAIRRRSSEATHWRTTGEVPSRLGGALVSVAVTDPALTEEGRAARFNEAETLLLESNKVLQESEGVDKKYKRDSLTRIVHLYEALEKPDKAGEWQQKLDAFDKAEVKPAPEEKSEPERK